LHQQRSTFGSAITSRPSSYLASLTLSDEVQSALDAKKPLVALESTIISHGMPYPQNFETAIEVEKIVRDNGATPATIAIIDGQVQIGLSQDQIRHLAKLGRAAVKASRRDMAVVMSKVKRESREPRINTTEDGENRCHLTPGFCSISETNRRHHGFRDNASRASRRDISLCDWGHWGCSSRIRKQYAILAIRLLTVTVVAIDPRSPN
jgi:hypothetical protein